uniref:Glutamine amidotransferase class 1 domain containing 3 n=1 Tax=Macaca fascicularis TaxID=9541 RepID=A0A7N9ICM5_MACFA
MAAVRALVGSRLAAASAFASLSPAVGRLPSAQPFTSPRRSPRPRSRWILVHLSRGGAEVQIFAPDVPQMHVIDHTKGQPSESESRNVLTESARIARGKITDLAKLSAANHDATIFPGGFGAAKNLSTFAVDGKDCKVNKEVERVLKEFHQAGKPIGHYSTCTVPDAVHSQQPPSWGTTADHAPLPLLRQSLDPEADSTRWVPTPSAPWLPWRVTALQGLCALCRVQPGSHPQMSDGDPARPGSTVAGVMLPRASPHRLLGGPGTRCCAVRVSAASGAGICPQLEKSLEQGESRNCVDEHL